MLFALTLGMDSSCCAVSAYDFPSLEHLLHLLHRARACVFLLQLLGQLRAQLPQQRDGNLDLVLLGIRFERDWHDTACIYTSAPACCCIHNLNSAPVPNCAAPSVTVDSHFGGSLGFAHTSRVSKGSVNAALAS